MPRVKALTEHGRRLQAREQEERRRAEQLLDRQEARLQVLVKRLELLCKLVPQKKAGMAREMGISNVTLRSRLRHPEGFTMAEIMTIERIALSMNIDFDAMGCKLEEDYEAHETA